MSKLDLKLLILVHCILFFEPVLGGQTNSKKCFFGNAEKRIGVEVWGGITQVKCEALGNCWDAPGIPGIKSCFKPQRSERLDCDYGFPEKRVEGGWPGVSREECENLGNCFDTEVSNAKFCFKPKRLSQYIIQSPRVNDWGDWGEWAICPDNSFVYGVDLKIEPPQGSAKENDDTGLNGIKLYCKTVNAIVKTISSSVGPWGQWRGVKHCDGPALAFQLRSEKPLGCLDDSAATDFRLICSGGEKLESGMLKIGDWTKEQRCPRGTAICGIRTQIEKDQGGHFPGAQCLVGDDTSLNNIDTACCDLENPLKTCNASYSWTTLSTWRIGGIYSATFTTGIKVEAGSGTNETNYVMGSSALTLLEANLKQKYRSKRFNERTVSAIFQKISIERKIIAVKMLTCATGMIEVLEFYCGLYTVTTAEFRCKLSASDLRKRHARYYSRTGADSTVWDNLFLPF